MKSSIDLESRLERGQARKLLTQILKADPTYFTYGKYFIQRMDERDLIIGDIINTLHMGEILTDAEFEKGQWRYRVETKKIIVVVSFENPSHIRGVTCWRKKGAT